MNGREMCGLSKDDFCARAPVFVGDILWEHLQLLQQECDKDKAALKNAPPKLSEISTAANMTGSSPPRMYNASPVPTYTTLEPSRVQHQSPVYHQRASPAPVYQRSSPAPYEQRLPTPDQYKPVESKPTPKAPKPDEPPPVEPSAAGSSSCQSSSSGGQRRSMKSLYVT